MCVCVCVCESDCISMVHVTNQYMIRVCVCVCVCVCVTVDAWIKALAQSFAETLTGSLSIDFRMSCTAMMSSQPGRNTRTAPWQNQNGTGYIMRLATMIVM